MNVLSETRTGQIGVTISGESSLSGPPPRRNGNLTVEVTPIVQTSGHMQMPGNPYRDSRDVGLRQRTSEGGERPLIGPEHHLQRLSTDNDRRL